jgi:hypothetical protein
MKTVQHKFVEFMPDQIEEGILYVSMEYCTAIHKCVCGCGNEVVTPISPTDWQLTFDGKSISLSPSIGNWSFDCKSHYWIDKNQIRHADRWTNDEIDFGRKNDKKKKKKYFSKNKNARKNKVKKIRNKFSFLVKQIKLIIGLPLNYRGQE